MPVEPTPNPSVTEQTTQEPDSSVDPGGTSETESATLTAEQVQQMIAEGAAANAAATASAVKEALAGLQSQPPAPEPAASPQSPVQDLFGTASDDDLPDYRTLRYMNQNIKERFGNLDAAAQQLYAQNVSNMESMSRMADPKIWESYGDELKTEIEKRKLTKVLEAQDFHEAIGVIKGRHIEDFIEERAQQMLATMPNAEGVGDGSALGGSLETTAEIPEQWKDIMTRNGLNERSIKEMLERRRSNPDDVGTVPTFEQYMKQMADHHIIRDDKEYTTFDLIPEKPNV